jgi:hypothetical protein
MVSCGIKAEEAEIAEVSRERNKENSAYLCYLCFLCFKVTLALNTSYLSTDKLQIMHPFSKVKGQR